ncbi:hypothetical protein OIU83_13195 [Flavobacterium sp. LS1R49]|uniref:Uncharacterized protein n=1 Tax=Flavobacterium shii TaxID=2987687 RepID=A0A9X3C7I7_9FLAO|nr:hypothetical protein [Flavobacterium shii]MCV9928618.1 hypothetical protein [Flavobacterium shii]
MIKKYVTTINIVYFLWGLVLLAISDLYPEFVRYYLYLSIISIIPMMIMITIKMRREDKLNGTTTFRSAIYRMLVMALMLGIFYFITKQGLV